MEVARRVRVSGLAGIGGAGLLIVVMVGLTFREHTFLATRNWSPIARSKTEWPSILAVGPQGWLMSTAFVLTSVCTVLLACGFTATRRERWLGALLAVVAIGLLGVAFPADDPDVTGGSWHAAIHNGLYPLIPIATVAAAITVAVSRPGTTTTFTSWFVRGSRVLGPMMLVSFGATNVDAIAQLARYFAFGATLAWAMLAGRDRVTASRHS